jgi:hypothetical protein
MTSYRKSPTCAASLNGEVQEEAGETDAAPWYFLKRCRKISGLRAF